MSIYSHRTVLDALRTAAKSAQAARDAAKAAADKIASERQAAAGTTVAPPSAEGVTGGQPSGAT